MILSSGQEKVFTEIRNWYRGGDKEFVLAGYAGTGKSTIANGLNASIGGGAKFVAFTGKAANVLRSKGCDATTLHKALYTPIDNNEIEELQKLIADAKSRGKFAEYDRLLKELSVARLNKNSPRFALNEHGAMDNAFVIVDEYSMLSEKLIADLRKVARKILYLGDPEQLPPVAGTCNLKPDAFLDEIHRQALDSPIIRYATDVRMGKRLMYTNEQGFLYGSKKDIPSSAYTMAEQIIVGRNATRIGWNNRFRKLRGAGFTDLPHAGEKLICLKNSPDTGLYNGMIVTAGRAEQQDDGYYTLDCEDEENGWQGLNVWIGDMGGRKDEYNYRQHGDYERFDFAYAITCHKAQGSEFGDVLIYNEPVGNTETDRRRWAYTAITRAKNKVVLVDPL